MPNLDEKVLSTDVIEHYYALISQVFGVRRHIDLMRWLQGDLQAYLPHEIMVAAWGDFHLGIIYYDVVSALPGVRSESAVAEAIGPLLVNLFNRWIGQDRAPYFLNVTDEGFTWDSVVDPGPISDALRTMRSAMVHGINDQRGRHDCLYVLFSRTADRRTEERSAFKYFLPYIDTALRQVDLLPNQYPSMAKHVPVTEALPEDDAGGEGSLLSDREAEIMKWVAMGKTNGEIGSILNVSSFTIKNHMQRIFKKLDVFNRAQAVSKFGSGNAQQVVLSNAD